MPQNGHDAREVWLAAMLETPKTTLENIQNTHWFIPYTPRRRISMPFPARRRHHLHCFVKTSGETSWLLLPSPTLAPIFNILFQSFILNRLQCETVCNRYWLTTMSKRRVKAHC
jgi:hypothetical protein